MTRVEAIRKLLALGELHPTEVSQIVGGDSTESKSALDELHRTGEVRMVDNGYGVKVCRLSDLARAHAFAEVTVVTRQRVEVVNFAEVQPC